MIAPLLLCCDLDRTLIPNGPQTASPEALPRSRRVAERPEVTLVYITGRSRDLLERAVLRWHLPQPDIAATDVGSAIHDVGATAAWTPWHDWHDRIARDWHGLPPSDLAAALAEIPTLTPQADDHQTPLKLCYTAPSDIDAVALQQTVSERLNALGVNASIIWSIDETIPLGLLDILPRSATKQGAIDFIRQRLGFTVERTLFAGDSGNDLPALSGPFRSVLVANATDAVRQAALRQAAENGNAETLYIAHGEFLGMNGAYTAGILEGMAHFFPEFTPWMK